MDDDITSIWISIKQHVFCFSKNHDPHLTSSLLFDDLQGWIHQFQSGEIWQVDRSPNPSFCHSPYWRLQSIHTPSGFFFVVPARVTLVMSEMKILTQTSPSRKRELKSLKNPHKKNSHEEIVVWLFHWDMIIWIQPQVYCIFDTVCFVFLIYIIQLQRSAFNNIKCHNKPQVGLGVFVAAPSDKERWRLSFLTSKKWWKCC